MVPTAHFFGPKKTQHYMHLLSIEWVLHMLFRGAPRGHCLIMFMLTVRLEY